MDGNEKGTRVLIAGFIAAIFLVALIYVGVSSLKTSSVPLWNLPMSTEDAKRAYSYEPNPKSSLITFTPGVAAWYVNEKLGFSFRLPDGFSAPDGKLQGVDTHVVELSNGKGSLLHIVALKIKEGVTQTLSEEAIRTNALEENLSNFTVGTLPDGTSGFIFETNSAEWGGDGIAFWFTKEGYLFMLTTAKKDAELLELVMKTWNFGRPVAPPPTTN